MFKARAAWGSGKTAVERRYLSNRPGRATVSGPPGRALGSPCCVLAEHCSTGLKNNEIHFLLFAQSGIFSNMFF